MENKILLLFTALICSLFDKTVNEQVKTNQIVLIFAKNPIANQYKEGPYTPNQIRYYTNDMVRNEVELKNKTKTDTIIIKTSKDDLPVDLFHSYVIYNYHFKVGDTAFFTFKDNIPFISKINRSVKPYDLNFSLNFKKRFNEQLISTNVLSLQPQQQIPKEKQFNTLYTNYENRKKYMDSLKALTLLSPELYKIYSIQNESRFLWNSVFNDKLMPFVEGIRKQFPADQIINNHDLLYNDFFHQFMAWQYLWSDQLKIPRIKGQQSLSIDHKIAYEKVKSNISDERVKEYLLFLCLQKIYESDSKANFVVYLTKFRTDVKDTRYNEYIKTNFDNQSKSIAGSTLLTNALKSKKTEFSNLIKSFKGNVVYVDFWASWCVPCRVAMPASHQLKLDYKGKPVKFLYISIDAQFSDWMKAAKDEGLIDDQNSLFMIDSRNALLPKQLGITTIPRYIIYNKKGELIYKQAPEPGTLEIRNILNKYVAEN